MTPAEQKQERAVLLGEIKRITHDPTRRRRVRAEMPR